jgi:hypothetical protein
MVYREKKEEENCVQYSGEEYKKFEMDRYGVHVEYCDDDEEDEDE